MAAAAYEGDAIAAVAESCVTVETDVGIASGETVSVVTVVAAADRVAGRDDVAAVEAVKKCATIGSCSVASAVSPSANY